MTSRKKTIFIGLLLSISFLIGCQENSEQNADDSKPKARGEIGEIIMVIDSAKYQGPVGDALREVFAADIPGLIRSEQAFKLRTVDPRAMNRMLRAATNIIFVTTFEDKRPGSRALNAQFSAASKEKASEDSTLYMLRAENEFAIGQEVIYLFGTNEEELIKNLEINKQKLQNLFEVRERERLAAGILRRKNSAINVKAEQKFGINFNVPASYQFVQEDEDFMWVRQPTATERRPDISLFIYRTDYVSEDQLQPENIIKLRDEITRERIFGDPANRSSYLEIQERATPAFRNITIDGRYAIELRTQWRTHTLSMGGSLLSYTVVDEKKGELYYMEGFVYYPSEAHGPSLREIETILMSTKFPEE